MHAEDIENLPNPSAVIDLDLFRGLYAVDEQKITKMQRHGLFGNILYDFMGAAEDGSSVFVGVGLGALSTEFDYNLTRLYNRNPFTLVRPAS